MAGCGVDDIQTTVPERTDVWAPLVLSLGKSWLSVWGLIISRLTLDGGGVRGLSSLYILREIMTEVKRLDEDAPESGRLENNGSGTPLPCHYFDFIIGTSTGGWVEATPSTLESEWLIP